MIEVIHLNVNKQVDVAVKIQVPDDQETPYKDKENAAWFVLFESLKRRAAA
jgi:hypothetical protein